MNILSKHSLPLGGFAGLTEHRLVTDSRVFRHRKSPDTWEGIGNFVYLADAQFNPYGETGMHPHSEIDVISVMVKGRVSHEGSLEHGRGLEEGDVQVQRAGGEGFSHNEVNPDAEKNRLIQLWVLPERHGEAAGYKYYSPEVNGVTRIYGGESVNDETFASATTIDIVQFESEGRLAHQAESLVYVLDGQADLSEVGGHQGETVKAGDLIRAEDFKLTAEGQFKAILISTTH